MKKTKFISLPPAVFINGRDGVSLNRFVIQEFKNKEMFINNEIRPTDL